MQSITVVSVHLEQVSCYGLQCASTSGADEDLLAKDSSLVNSPLFGMQVLMLADTQMELTKVTVSIAAPWLYLGSSAFLQSTVIQC